MKKSIKIYARKFQNKRREKKLARYLRRYKKTSPQIKLSDVKSIALLRWDGKLGDTIIMGVFLSLMAKYRPDIEITILAHGFPISWLKKINTKTKIISCGKRKAKTAKKLKQYQDQFDAVIDLSSEFTYKEFLALSNLNAKINIGYDHYNTSLADVKVPNNIINIKERYVYAAQLFISDKIDASKIELPTPAFEKRTFTNSAQSKQVAINLFGASTHRQFSFDSAKALLLNWLQEWPDETLVLIPVPNFTEFLNKLAQEINNDKIIVPSEEPSLELTLGIISASSLCFTPDTSVVHMASCLNTPTLAIYSENKKNFQEWQPFADKNRVLFNPAPSYDNEKVKVDKFSWAELVENKNALME